MSPDRRNLDRSSFIRRLTGDPIRGLREEIATDLNHLLNTRRTAVWPADLAHTVIGYGVPDLGVIRLADEAGKRAFVEDVEHSIRVFEPRLLYPKVTLDDGGNETDRVLRITIQGRLSGLGEAITLRSRVEPVAPFLSLNVDR